MSGHMAPPDTHGRAAGSNIIAPTLIVDIINVSWRILAVFSIFALRSMIFSTTTFLCHEPDPAARP